MDGVLVNNTRAHVRAFEIFCKRYGVEEWQRKLQTSFGMGNDDIMRQILPEEIIREKGLKALGEEKEAIYREVYAPEIRPVRGLVDLLEELRRRGIPCAVGSSGCRENVDFVLGNCGIADYFSCIVSGDRVTRCKPDPEIYLLAAEGLHLQPADCLVFEDARAGELLPPLISFPMQTDGLEVVKGRKYEFAPTVQSAENSTFLWTLRRPGAAEAEPVGDEAVYEFCEEIAGTYEVSLRTENEDGSDEMTIEVEVVDALAVSVTAVPIGRKYDGLTRTVSLDRTITLRPFIWNGTNPKFSWTIDGQEVGTELSYTYTPTETGIKKIVFTVTDTTDEPEMTLSKCITRTNETRATLEFTVECHSEEESHRRPASGASSATWDRVYEYTPAPGQFINELVSGGFTGTETSPEAAVAYAEERMKKNTWVSLGGWGGYIVVGFDHSIDNSSSGYKGGYNFSITGNAFKGSSEPGIVYVMQDTNGNTLPDDEWYELKGSEYGKEETVQDYAVTYYRPTYSGADVQWKDNQGVKGKIDYLKQYHDQPSYYPAWIGTDSYTLYGPCLKSRTYDQSGNGSYWVNGEYDWGYADNFGNDRLSEDDNAAAGAMKVYFKISNAVDKNGQPANLKYIDFIRVQTGVNAKAGWLGENSTEVFGFTDENINQGK